MLGHKASFCIKICIKVTRVNRKFTQGPFEFFSISFCA